VHEIYGSSSSSFTVVSIGGQNLERAWARWPRCRSGEHRLEGRTTLIIRMRTGRPI